MTVFGGGAAAQSKDGEVIFGSIPNFPPYMQIDNEGRPFGFAIDSAKEIARSLGLKIKFKVFENGSASRQALIDGEIDVLPSLGITEARLKILSFTIPIETFRIVYFVRTDSQEIKTSEDIFEHTIGVVRSNAANRILAERDGVNRKVFADAPSALFGLLSAQVDVVAYPEPVFLKLARDAKISDKFKIVGEPLAEIKRGMAIGKENPELLALLNGGVEKFINSPEYREIYARHFGQAAAFWTGLRLSVVMAVILILTAVVMATWRYYSLMRVNRRLKVSMSERERVSDELRQSEQRFKDFTDAASDWFWETDQNHKLTYLSQRFYDVTGFRPEQRLGKSRRELVSKEFLKQNPDKWTKFEQTLNDHLPYKAHEITATLPDGSEIHLSSNGKPIFDDEGSFLGYRGTTTDITGQKKAETDRAKNEHQQQLNQKLELQVRISERTEQLEAEIEERRQIQSHLLEATANAEAANLAKSEFLANMSHELRTPLNAIIGFSETLNRHIFGEMANEKQQEYIEDINSAGEHLLDLINDILDVSAIEAGKIEIHESEVDTKQVAEDAILMMKTIAEGGRVELLNLVDGKGLKLRADERRVKQILVNMISNAIKFTKQDGIVKVEGGQQKNGAFVYKIIDNGIGMSEADLAKAMEKFIQIRTTLGKRKEGTGLGLPLTNGLIEAHGGTLHIESESGIGTTVTIEFPKERVIS